MLGMAGGRASAMIDEECCPLPREVGIPRVGASRGTWSQKKRAGRPSPERTEYAGEGAFGRGGGSLARLSVFALEWAVRRSTTCEPRSFAALMKLRCRVSNKSDCTKWTRSLWMSSGRETDRSQNSDLRASERRKSRGYPRQLPPDTFDVEANASIAQQRQQVK
jgi:hypothetical protein